MPNMGLVQTEKTGVIGHVLQAALYTGVQADRRADAGSLGTGREKQVWS